MTVNDLATHDVRDQFSAYVDPRHKDTKNYHEHGEDFDAWLENVKAEAEAKGREKAFEEVYATLDGQEGFMGTLVKSDEAAGTPNGFINASFIGGIVHARSAIQSAKHLAELPEGLSAVAFSLPINDPIDGKK